MNTPAGQTPLENVIRHRIRQRAGITVADYMRLCLTHPEHGYYTTRQPFGAGGDFITAPEASQMFGELIGIWTIACWQLLARPRLLNLVELGPGRGLLMADLLRAAGSRPQLLRALRVHLVEISPHLRAEQKRRLAPFGPPLHWHDDLPTPEELGNAPVLVIANEFFDALPVHHHERTEEGWRERLVVEDATGALAFAATGTPLSQDALPRWAHDHPPGAIIELSPERAEYARRLGALLRATGGAALVIDYGHTRPGPGETLQALYRHRRVGVFHRPGETDITAHVDFAALAESLRASGLATPPPLEQGRFLLGLGLEQRLRDLLANADDAQAARLLRGAGRIAGIGQMGSLFKVLCAHHPHMPTPPPFTAPRITA